MSYKVALLGIYHESNTFAPQLTTLSDFQNGHCVKGDAIRSEYMQAHHEIGGMLAVMDQHDIEVVPIMYAEATPGGMVSSETYALLLADMMQELERALPVDGCLVVPHGAGVSEDFPDLDGHWLSLLRERVGLTIPIMGTLDLHANVSPLMVSSTDALVAYKQNPHVDQRQRGMDAAQLLVDSLQGKIRPTQTLVQVPMAISIEQQFTEKEPCKSLYKYAEALSLEPNILSISILHGFPYADVQEMGTSIIVIADHDPAAGLEIGSKLCSYLLRHRHHFVGNKIDIPSALELIAKYQKPVLLLDMGDNVGGGGPANNLGILEALEADNRYRYFVCIYDPASVIEAIKHDLGDVINLTITGTDQHGEREIDLKVTLVHISSGNFSEENPRHGGQVNFRMGQTVVVSTAIGSLIMLTSLRVVPFSLGQLTSCQIEPTQFDAIVAKGVNAPIAAYAPVCPSSIQVNTPGVTQADMTLFDFKNRRKPLFPFENIVK